MFPQNRNQWNGSRYDPVMAQYWDKKNMDVQAEELKREVEIRAKLTVEDYKTAIAIQRKETLADVESKKELQRTEVLFTPDHDVILHRECFGEDIRGRLPIKILRALLLRHENETGRDVLFVQVKKGNGEEAFLYWDTGKSENRWIRSVFEKAGISFGFGEKKETEIRRKVLLAAANMADSMVLAERHGWYRLDGEWQYAFPEELTWKEVDQRC